MSKWSSSDDVTLEELLSDGINRAEIAVRLNRTERAIVSRAHRLGLLSNREWSDAEIAILISRYTENGGVVHVASIAKELNRSLASVHLKASRLGLGDFRRPKKPESERVPPRSPKFTSVDELRRHQSAMAVERIKRNGHPRGALGMKHSDDTKRAIAEKSRKWQADKVWTPEMKQQLSDKMLENIKAGKMRSGYSRSRGGKRDDLNGIYFRSAWEANYARYLNLLVSKGEIVRWEYEPETFIFERIKRGTRAYTPDFKIHLASGAHEWHEVKGWMDKKSKTRLARFAKYFPAEKLIVVDGAWFKSASKTVASLISGWESGTVHLAKRTVVKITDMPRGNHED